MTVPDVPIPAGVDVGTANTEQQMCGLASCHSVLVACRVVGLVVHGVPI